MLNVRSLLRGAGAVRAAAARAQVCLFATGPRQEDSKFYEFRTYNIKPSMMKEFMKLSQEHVPRYTAYAELIGYWIVDLGILNKVLHIWKYDSFAHRTEAQRKSLQDQEWQEKMISKALPMLDKICVEVAYLVPWCQLGKPEKAGMYEMVTFQMKQGGPAIWGEAFKTIINTHVSTDYNKLIGVFHTEYGLLSKVHVLWWYENADSRASGRHLSHEDPRMVAAVRESLSFVESQQNMLLIPALFSPLK
ncbi:protein NipSnap homolog 3A-like [Rhinatrema bivittatum]|uniref:protein NipSnap homolog 3A-like n=1 Tax=Rhinatrema bivittatum TaxID=194408 RepID=UPI00112CE3F1|nr:protein NipSnap homolog 3A-like [Rhinatrema bivittatum]